MADMIYVPASDSDVQQVAKQVKAILSGTDAPTTGPSEAKLGTLKDSSSNLYIVGHGNFGHGIGTKTTCFGGKTLAAQLVAAGLHNVQMDLTIYLVACNSGVAMGEKKKGVERRPYFQRFADGLAGLQFTNTKVVGYAGFITSNNLQSNLEMKKGLKPTVSDPRGAPSIANTGQQEVKERTVVYTVNGGVATAAATNKLWKLNKSVFKATIVQK